eukprot:jgi/Mesen1/2654/ME000167S01806
MHLKLGCCLVNLRTGTVVVPASGTILQMQCHARLPSIRTFWLPLSSSAVFVNTSYVTRNRGSYSILDPRKRTFSSRPFLEQAYRVQSCSSVGFSVQLSNRQHILVRPPQHRSTFPSNRKKQHRVPQLHILCTSSQIESTMETELEAIHAAADLFKKPEGVVFSYGTAGFRAEASTLSSTVMRAGIIAALRSLGEGAATGVMVTASHNPVCDNGVKIADPSGGMLAVAWEDYCNRLANAESSAHVCQVVRDIASAEGLDLRQAGRARVLLAYDTRPSGAELAAAVKVGIQAVGGAAAVRECGVLSTPQLHWLVRAANRHPASATPAHYFASLSAAFQSLKDTDGAALESLLADGANGVGALKLEELSALVRGSGLLLEVRNRGREGEGALNDGVGADFVQKEQRLPAGFSPQRDCNRRCVSVDGDADRLVYFYLSAPAAGGSAVPPPASASPQVEAGEEQPPASSASLAAPTFHLLDGDKIAALAACFIAEQLRTLAAVSTSSSSSSSSSNATTTATATARPDGAAEARAGGGSRRSSRSRAGEGVHIKGYGEVRVGVVQTAYANGASSEYLARQPGVQVARTLTGVKHLHLAAEEYDMGVYFEANGHGTVLFGDHFHAWLLQQRQVATAESNGGSGGGNSSDPKGVAIQRLAALAGVMNQAVGDALSGVLLVEAVLRHYAWSVRDWDRLYADLPSRQLKVRVADRTKIETTDAETRVVAPAGLQDAIAAAAAEHERGRAFVRPSGTEDVVRVYAEAASQASADALAQAVALHVHRLAGGSGAPP